MIELIKLGPIPTDVGLFSGEIASALEREAHRQGISYFRIKAEEIEMSGEEWALVSFDQTERGGGGVRHIMSGNRLDEAKARGADAIAQGMIAMLSIRVTRGEPIILNPDWPIMIRKAEEQRNEKDTIAIQARL